MTTKNIGDSASETSSPKPEINLARVPNYPVPPVRSEAALKRIGVTPEQLRNAPQITEILKEVQGGITLAIRAMRLSQQELIVRFLEKYDAIPDRDLESTPIEAIAIACNIDIRHLWGEIMLAMRESSVNSVKIIAVAAHPEIMKKRVEYAQTPGGYRDRDALDTMLGALPSPKGPTFIGKYFASSNPEPEDAGVKTAPIAPAEELVSDENFIFPDCEVIQEKLQPLRKLLQEKS
jgi:hypothetical protein